MVFRLCKSTRLTVGGFTLIEVMVVVIIIGILATIIVPRILEHPEQARQVRVKMDIRALQTVLSNFKLDTRRFPTTSEGLEALVKNPGIDGWREGGYLDQTPDDPWGRPYIYLCPGSESRDYDLLSHGRDGQPGGTGYDADIKSWEIK